MKSPTVVSLFTGAGGLDYGFEAAGFHTRVAVEIDQICCATLEANTDWAVIDRDIHEVSSQQILECGDLRPGDVDVLIGGPPCQPFSKAGYWARGDTKRLADPRADTLVAYMQCVRDFQPKAFLLENVHGISYSGKEEGLRLLQQLTAEINEQHGTAYRLTWAVLNAADYGVPQLRRRFFLVAERDGKPFEFPEPTHGPAGEDQAQADYLARSLAPYVTAWDAIGDLHPDSSDGDLRIKGRWADLLPSIPEGENYLWHTNRKGGMPLFGWRTRYWSFLLKLAKHLPSWTIQAQPGPAIGPLHWANRYLSARELMRLQTFPDHIILTGNRSAVQRQVGNAVPSLLAEILARAMADQFFGMPLSPSPSLTISLKRPIPSAEAVQPVPAKYHHLAGEHDDHPGTGRGPAGRQLQEVAAEVDADDEVEVSA